MFGKRPENSIPQGAALPPPPGAAPAPAAAQATFVPDVKPQQQPMSFGAGAGGARATPAPAAPPPRDAGNPDHTKRSENYYDIKSTIFNALIDAIDGAAITSQMIYARTSMQLLQNQLNALAAADKVEKNEKPNEKVDESKLKTIALKFSLCHPAGCTAELELTKDIIDGFKQVERALKKHPHAALRHREMANEADPVEYCTRALRALAYDVRVMRKLKIRFDRTIVMEDFDVTLQLLRLAPQPRVVAAHPCSIPKGEKGRRKKGCP